MGGLFRQMRQNGGKRRAIRAAENAAAPGDATLLYRIALETPHAEAAVIAVEGIKDAAMLSNLALHHNMYAVRLAAIRRLDDQTALRTLALNGSDRWLRNAAVARLTDQALLTQIATDEEDALLRDTAIDALSDDAALMRVALQTEGEWRQRALDAMKDGASLLALAQTAQDPALRKEAARRISDPKLALRLAVSECADDAFLIAAEKLNAPGAWDALPDNGSGEAKAAVRAEIKERWNRLREAEILPLWTGELCPHCGGRMIRAKETVQEDDWFNNDSQIVPGETWEREYIVCSVCGKEQ